MAVNDGPGVGKSGGSWNVHAGPALEPPPRVRYEDVHELASAYLPEKEVRRIRKAYVFCAKAHEGQSRRSGEPYLVHPLAVAARLAAMRLDATSVVAGLLHDVLEDTSVSHDSIEELFGEDVMRVVDGVTKLSRLDFATKAEAQVASFRKMILAVADDLRVIIVKLADRLHNMLTLGYLPREKQLAVAQETRAIFAPIAHRLGMGRMRNELEDLSFAYTEPELHARLVGELEQRRNVEQGFIRRTEKRLRDVMSEANIRARVFGRRKSLASIHRKLVARNIGIEEVYDYLAFRLIVPTVPDCYGALGAVHATWTPIQSRFKDFIATPKPNGYQSVHTTVISESDHPFEVQIRTEDMHLIAEEGVAAHWGYKEGAAPSPDEVERFSWLRNLLEAQRDLADPDEFMEAVRLDLYGDEVYCFTPKGEVKVLPAGSTPLDFAYAIHTEVGHHCVGARIDGALVPLRSRLEHGNRVEIVTAPSARPRRDWLKHVVTSRARSKIRAWFNARDRVEAIEIGRSVLDREAKRHRRSARKLLQSPETSQAIAELGFRDADDFLLGLAREHVGPQALLVRLGIITPAADARAQPVDEQVPAPPRRRRRRLGRSPIIAGDGDVANYLARCCSPVRGEPVRGFITRGRGVAVHRTECRNLKALAEDPSRLMDVSWSADSTSRFDVRLRLSVENRPGMLSDVTGVLSAHETNIRHATARALSGRRGAIHLVVDIEDSDHLERIRRALLEIRGVDAVSR